MDFDHTSAWYAIALPNYLRLPQKFREANVRAIELLKDEEQDFATFDIALLPEVVNLFEGFDSNILSCASYLIDRLEFWFPIHSCPNELRKFEKEGSWKVSNVLDQMLHKRLELPRNNKVKLYKQFFVYEIHNGQICVAFATDNVWICKEICWATRIPKLPELPPRKSNSREWEWEEECKEVLDNWAKEMRATEPNWYDTRPYKKRG